MAATSGTYLKYAGLGGGGGSSQSAPLGGTSGVTIVGAFSGASQPNGASISGQTITFGPADSGNPGMVKASGSQTLSATLTLAQPVTLQSPLSVVNGGTGATSATPFAPIFASSTGTGPYTQFAFGSSGQFLMSNGINLYPQWNSVAATAPNLTGDVASTGSVTSVVAIQGWATTAAYSIPPQEFFAGNGSSATIVLNFVNGASQRVSVNGSFSIGVAGGVVGGTYLAKLVASSGVNIITWPSSNFCWASSTLPTFSATSGFVDLVSIYFDGVVYRASASVGYPF